LLFAGMLGAVAAQAGLIVGARPPELAAFASDTSSVFSQAAAASTFYGTLQSRACVGFNAQAWSCRETVEQLDPLADANRRVQTTSDPGTTVSASRDGRAFDTDDGFADYLVANARSRARSDFGSNKTEALARDAASWNETRVLDGDDGTLRTEEDFNSSAWAASTSRWVEAFTTAIDGPVTFVFSVTQHQAQLFGGSLEPERGSIDRRAGDGFGEYILQLFDLNRPTTYGDGERFPFQEGFELAADASIGFDASSPNGTQHLFLTFDALAEGRYSLVSQLQVEVIDNALLDLFGTALLERIEVGAGQTLDFVSGTPYRIVAPDDDPQGPGTVPEPATLALLALGLAGVAASRGRWSAR
jgi:hypothetical protein